ncbi:MAG TPA: nucleoside triphosphate pyrophosphohydrolase [Gammaproteobacteria bacterium]|nr:nucleoside triphosphate pyrophosphohydrolase [Gammaproteobacteria bacterium]
MANIDQLLAIMDRLRDPQRGCPWDRQQAHASLVPYLLEEAYETADTIEQQDWDHLPDELGDLLFQIVFHARLGKEAGRFDFDTVVTRICDKLVRRHPHVFADTRFDSIAEQTADWEARKQAEREAKAGGRTGVLEGVSTALPALTRAEKLQRRAARVGFDWPEAHGVLDKIREETDELATEMAQGGSRERLAGEVGDLLFSVVNLARHLGVDAESALREANRRFERRFAAMETRLAERGGITAADPAAMDAAWEAVKRGEREDAQPEDANEHE